jgi:hypothetical protein
VDQTVYQAEISVKREAWDEDKKPYRWLNPDYVEAFYKESEKRQVDTDIAWDEIKFIDLEMEEDFLEKATAIFSGEEYHRRTSQARHRPGLCSCDCHRTRARPGCRVHRSSCGCHDS